MAGTRFGQGFGVAADQFGFPFAPGGAAVRILKRHEQRVVRQPESVFLAELAIIGRRVGQQAGRCFMQDRVAQFIQPAVVHAVRCAAPVDRLVLLRQQQAVFGQQVKIDKIRIARKGGKRLVRAVAIAGGADWQDLPIPLTGPVQKIDKIARSLAHCANAIGGGQAGQVHQDTAGTLHQTSTFQAAGSRRHVSLFFIIHTLPQKDKRERNNSKHFSETHEKGAAALCKKAVAP